VVVGLLNRSHVPEDWSHSNLVVGVAAVLSVLVCRR
jgi:hypothetical protein